MKLNVDYLKEMLKERKWSMGKLALKTNLSSATISRLLSCKRGVGAKTIGALIKVFPEESLDGLFFLE